MGDKVPSKAFTLLIDNEIDLTLKLDENEVAHRNSYLEILKVYLGSTCASDFLKWETEMITSSLEGNSRDLFNSLNRHVVSC
jgi:hypothetical protein